MTSRSETLQFPVSNEGNLKIMEERGVLIQIIFTMFKFEEFKKKDSRLK